MAVTKAKPPFFGLVQYSTSNNQHPNTQRPRINVGSIYQLATQEPQSSMQTPPLKLIPEGGGFQDNNPTNSNFIKDLHPKLEPQEPETQRRTLASRLARLPINQRHHSPIFQRSNVIAKRRKPWWPQAISRTAIPLPSPTTDAIPAKCARISGWCGRGDVRIRSCHWYWYWY
jgi:hypothetical protein